MSARKPPVSEQAPESGAETDATNFSFPVPEGGARVDRLVADACGWGRRRTRLWLSRGWVRVDGRRVHAGDSPRAGQRIDVTARWDSGAGEEDALGDEARRDRGPGPGTRHPAAGPAESGAPLPPQPRVLALTGSADGGLLALAKPAGVHSHRGLSLPCAADFVEEVLGSQAEVGERPEEAGIVHRLDRDTSGVLLAARTRRDYLRLRDAFRNGQSLKFYLALVSGRLREEGTIDLALARRARRVVAAGRHDRNTLEAQTFVVPLDGGTDWTLVLASMRSGVTHQIRAHLASIGHGLLGDSLYGDRAAPPGSRSGQLLHAARVKIDGEIDVCAPAPGDFLRAYAALRRGAGGATEPGTEPDRAISWGLS